MLSPVQFEELKQRQSVMWGAGAFEEIEATIADMHETLAAALRPGPGVRWLDVASGTGAVAFIAARAGADVTGVDLAPTLVETARRRADEQGLAVRFDVGDAENLPYEDASFDAVSSNVGVMFAPSPEAVARELARVTKPGGRLGVTAWRPHGGVGRMFAMLRPFQPPPPEGVPNPLEWGKEEVVQRLLGDAFELELEELDTVHHAESAEEEWERFSTFFGPLRTLVESLDEERREELHQAFVDFTEEDRTADGIVQSRTYLLIRGIRR
jgi:ubiquinone/menaquinone biosynthesis C-methylase UbiE